MPVKRLPEGSKTPALAASLAMLCSIIIPTIGRDSLTRAVDSVLAQTIALEKIEIIVVNDSGSPLPAAAWQSSPQIAQIDTNKRERSVARNSGAAIAKGKYLYFLDDDDWLLPCAIETLERVAEQNPNAVWLYAGIQVVNDKGEVMGTSNSRLNGNAFAQIMGGAWAPIQTSFIRADAFFEVGGFDPAIGATQDLDLCRRIALVGDFANSRKSIACLYRGSQWHSSTNYDPAAMNIKISRNNLLNAPNAFRRMRQSANGAYWRGRICRVYLSAFLFNIHKQRWMSAFSRVIWGVTWLFIAGRYLFASQFWAGVRDEHTPDSLHMIEKNHQKTSPSP